MDEQQDEQQRDERQEEQRDEQQVEQQARTGGCGPVSLLPRGLCGGPPRVWACC